MKKRIFAAFVCLCMLMALVPSMAYANDTVYTGGLCEHHTRHNGACGYAEGTAEIPCSYEHNESCGGLTDPTACNHTHDEACGYVPATEGTPCTFVCEVCNPQDNGNPEAPSDAQPEECTCENPCTDEEINGDCPVCSAEGAELDKVCVGAALLLTAPTLRTGEIELYVGGQQIKESGCYENISGTWTKVDGTEPANGQFSYDADRVTLTLNQAKIVNYQDVTVGGGFTYPGSVIAFSQSADVSLTIVVSQGTSTITGTGGIRVVSKAGDASLSISGPGSLEVNVDRNDSGITLIGSKNVNLNIDGADVKTLAVYYYGVDLHAGDGFKAAAVVNNGKLTAGGSGGIGIYYRWTNPSDSGTSSLTVSGNAVVDTRDSKILIASQASEVQVSAGSDGNGGIVFDGKNGTVYGKVELQEELEIGTDETLTIGKDASLTVPENVKLTNNGKINNSGKLTGTITGNQPPKITTANLHDGTVGEPYTETTLAVTGNAPISWQLANGSTLPAGLKLSEEGKISGTPTTASTYKFTVTATNDNGSDSKEFTLFINEETKYSLTVNLNGGNGTTTVGQYTKGIRIQIDAGTKSGYRFAGWTSSNGGSFADASSASTTFTMPANDTTITANWKKKSSGGSVFFWDLKFDTNGGSKIDTVTEWEYSTIDLDEYVPEKEGYKFVGWYADEDLTKKIDEVYLTQDTTVYAKWEKIAEEVSEEPEEVEETEETETISFKDVKENDWFYEAVSYAVENGLMNGMSEDVFAPNTPLTREMLAVVLYNVEGQPESAGVNPFTDVKADIWYTDAILWANENGIVAGYDNSAYGVGDLITREQFATILYRYAQFKGYDTTQGGMAVREFSDYENISDYARPAMAWAVNAGIMGGMDDGTLMPQGKATRAEAATMLMNFCENMVEK
ncbi:S-layer homology domain-containing protein [Anaerotignum lactatifermentans]|uniref:S-layer homology domain-containing protein n=1 Tax=Anaerotignum lactatifermentans TaxID=160404 RepID=UPI00266BB1BD|nr:S-layer homology domain-containing protein [Anaerotignum lactatifermentans]